MFIEGIDHGRKRVTTTTPNWFAIRRRDVLRMQLEGRPRRTTNRKGVVAETPKVFVVNGISYFFQIIFKSSQVKYLLLPHTNGKLYITQWS